MWARKPLRFDPDIHRLRPIIECTNDIAVVKNNVAKVIELATISRAFRLHSTWIQPVWRDNIDGHRVAVVVQVAMRMADCGANANNVRFPGILCVGIAGNRRGESYNINGE
jgi:hypothetical protein